MSRFNRQSFALGVVGGAALAAFALGGAFYFHTAAGDSDSVSRHSYSAAWSYVDTFQPREGVSAGYGGPDDFLLGPMTDAEMLDRCADYTANTGALAVDRIDDPQAFLLGCSDAVRVTQLESP